MTDDARWLARAVALARRGRGWTAPNPAVGAVLVRDGRVVGEGFTQPVGGHHAEVMALADCAVRGEDPAGATLYVTLEPCCHHGRTPPCTDAVLRSRVARVVVGVLDPFPVVLGRSMALLRAAGIRVDLVDDADCARQILGFGRAHTHGLPEVTCKVAASLDGRIATAAGESRWITGDAARVDGHRLRASHDAILVGIGTVLADDPALTTRLPDGEDLGRPVTHPVPVVLDTQLRIPADAAIFRHPRRPILVCGDDAPERDLPADIVRSGTIEGTLRALAARGLHRVLVEGGARVHRSLVDARLVDTLVLYLAPLAIPGGIPWLAGDALGALGDAPRGEIVGTERLGSDLRVELRLKHLSEG